nr:immunoglobulin light chain junction region [Macaca mulatta]
DYYCSSYTGNFFF